MNKVNVVTLFDRGVFHPTEVRHEVWRDRSLGALLHGGSVVMNERRPWTRVFVSCSLEH